MSSVMLRHMSLMKHISMSTVLRNPIRMHRMTRAHVVADQDILRVRQCEAVRLPAVQHRTCTASPLQRLLRTINNKEGSNAEDEK